MTRLFLPLFFTSCSLILDFDRSYPGEKSCKETPSPFISSPEKCPEFCNWALCCADSPQGFCSGDKLPRDSNDFLVFMEVCVQKCLEIHPDEIDSCKDLLLSRFANELSDIENLLCSRSTELCGKILCDSDDLLLLYALVLEEPPLLGYHVEISQEDCVGICNDLELKFWQCIGETMVYQDDYLSYDPHYIIRDCYERTH